MNKFLLGFFSLLGNLSIALAQDADSLLSTLNENPTVQSVSSTFKSTRIVLSHSSETQKKHDLDFRIRHHFGDVGGPFGSSHTLYGLDVASDLYIGFDYGLTNKTTIGIGRSKHDELYNFFIKQKALEQKQGGSPLTLTLLAQAGVITREKSSAQEFIGDSSRTSYFLQAILARKLSSRLSLQVSPGYLLRSEHYEAGDQQNLFALGFAGRLKFSKRLSLIADYQLVNAFGRSNEFTESYFNPLGLGLEIETGGHVFSLNFMNSEHIIENNFLATTDKSWRSGGVRFGFTISRNFSLKKSTNKDIESKIY